MSWAKVAQNEDAESMFGQVLDAIAKHWKWQPSHAETPFSKALVEALSAHSCIQNGGYQSLFTQVLYGYGFPEHWERALALADAQQALGLVELAEGTRHLYRTLLSLGLHEASVPELNHHPFAPPAQQALSSADSAYYAFKVDAHLQQLLHNNPGLLDGLPLIDAPSPTILKCVVAAEQHLLASPHPRRRLLRALQWAVDSWLDEELAKRPGVTTPEPSQSTLRLGRQRLCIGDTVGTTTGVRLTVLVEGTWRQSTVCPAVFEPHVIQAIQQPSLRMACVALIDAVIGTASQQDDGEDYRLYWQSLHPDAKGQRSIRAEEHCLRLGQAIPMGQFDRFASQAPVHGDVCGPPTRWMGIERDGICRVQTFGTLVYNWMGILLATLAELEHPTR